MKFDNWQLIALLGVMFTGVITVHIWAPSAAALIVSMVSILFSAYYVERHANGGDAVAQAKADAAAAEVKRIEAVKLEAQLKAEAAAKAEAARVEAEKKAADAAIEAATKTELAAKAAEGVKEP